MVNELRVSGSQLNEQYEVDVDATVALSPNCPVCACGLLFVGGSCPIPQISRVASTHCVVDGAAPKQDWCIPITYKMLNM